MDVNRLFLPSATVLFILAAMVWPSVRLYRRTGTVAVTFQRNTDLKQRVIGALFGLSLLGLLIWTVLYAVLGPAPLGIVSLPNWWNVIAWAAMISGLIFVLKAQVEMGDSWRIGIDDKPTELVTGGLFRFVRNPIFSAMLFTAFGLVGLTPAVPSIAGWVIMAALVRLQCRFEEHHLITLHGDAYREYAARVGRLVPGMGRLRDQ